MQPTCPRCKLNPTAFTLQVDESTWQDVCKDCYNKAVADKEVVADVTAVPIQIDEPVDQNQIEIISSN